MPLTLTSFDLITRHNPVAKYNLTHSTPGPDGTVLSQPLKLSKLGANWSVELLVENCEAASPDEALARMVVWLRRLADGLENRGTSVALPL